MLWAILIIAVLILIVALASLGGIQTLKWRLKLAQEDIDALRAQVAESTTVMTGAAALITSLADRLEAAADDPDEIRAIVGDLRGGTDTLAAAVAENTVAADEPPAEEGEAQE